MPFSNKLFFIFSLTFTSIKYHKPGLFPLNRGTYVHFTLIQFWTYWFNISSSFQIFPEVDGPKPLKFTPHSRHTECIFLGGNRSSFGRGSRRRVLWWECSRCSTRSLWCGCTQQSFGLQPICRLGPRWWWRRSERQKVELLRWLPLVSLLFV